MREELLVVSAREEHRAMILTRVLSGQWTQEEAATVLQRSVRQVRRLQQAYAREGVRALVHGNRGRRPAHALAAGVRERIVGLAQAKYAGFNHQHLTEKLGDEGIVVGAATGRRVLRAPACAAPARGGPRSIASGGSAWPRPASWSKRTAAGTAGWARTGRTGP